MYNYGGAWICLSLRSATAAFYVVIMIGTTLHGKIRDIATGGVCGRDVTSPNQHNKYNSGKFNKFIEYKIRQTWKTRKHIDLEML